MKGPESEMSRERILQCILGTKRLGEREVHKPVVEVDTKVTDASLT